MEMKSNPTLPAQIKLIAQFFNDNNKVLKKYSFEREAGVHAGFLNKYCNNFYNVEKAEQKRLQKHIDKIIVQMKKLKDSLDLALDIHKEI